MLKSLVKIISVRTATFSTKSAWSVFFRSEIAVICHKISVKCWWNQGETFTAKIYKLGPKCRWQPRGENHTCTHTCNCIVTCIPLFFVCLVLLFYYFVLYISIWSFDTGFFSGIHFIYKIYEHASCFAYII